MANDQKIPYIDAVNAALTTAVPTLGLAFALFNMMREQFRRHGAGEPEMTLAEQATYMVEHGQSISDTSHDWLAAHGYDRQGNKIS